jgi:hypothetical protein
VRLLIFEPICLYITFPLQGNARVVYFVNVPQEAKPKLTKTVSFKVDESLYGDFDSLERLRRISIAESLRKLLRRLVPKSKQAA